MARSGIEIFEDDEEADLATFMLDACGLKFSKFMFNESILTRENFEKNYDVLLKMAENRGFSRATYLLLAYFTLITGVKLSENFRQEILEVADGKHEDGRWVNEEITLIRKKYLEDFREKIRFHKQGQKLHPVSFKYSDKDFMDSKVLIGINQFRDFLASKKSMHHHIEHLNLDGWNLKTFPQEIFELQNLKTLSLEYNQITHIPEEISNLTSLKILFLKDNQLTFLPDSIGKLPLLKSLRVCFKSLIYFYRTSSLKIFCFMEIFSFHLFISARCSHKFSLS